MVIKLLTASPFLCAQGSFAQVFSACHRTYGHVAVKEFRPEHSDKSKAFMAELRAVQNLDHPNIVRYASCSRVWCCGENRLTWKRKNRLLAIMHSCFGGNLRRRWIVSELCEISLTTAIHAGTKNVLRQVGAKRQELYVKWYSIEPLRFEILQGVSDQMPTKPVSPPAKSFSLKLKAMVQLCVLSTYCILLGCGGPSLPAW
eukprot:SAG11_NODE_938_length_6471_cov_4.156780_6_plen_201_part_00